MSKSKLSSFQSRLIGLGRLTKTAKEWGVNFHLGPIGRKGSRTLYFFDPDGNYIQMDDRAMA